MGEKFGLFVCRSFDTLEHVADGKGLSMRHDATWLHNTFYHFKSFRRAAFSRYRPGNC